MTSEKDIAAKIERLQHEIALRDEQMFDMEQTIDHLRAQLAEAQREIARLNQRLPPSIVPSVSGCVCPIGAERTCNSPFCGRRDRPFTIT